MDGPVSIEARVAEQYGALGFADAIVRIARILATETALRRRGPLTARDLASFDGLHIGGTAATAGFLAKLQIAPGTRWLDVGAGVGGASRHAVDTFGCHVTAIDITPEFCAAAETLNAAVGMSDRIAVVQGSALAMPFGAGAFDGAFTLHAGMNIEDKPTLYREVHRVLKSGAEFGIYDILAGPAGGALKYPLPWAATPEANFLVGIGELRRILDAAGFASVRARDVTGYARDFYRSTEAREAAGRTRRSGPGSILGDEYYRRIANAGLGFEEGRCTAWGIIVRKP